MHHAPGTLPCAAAQVWRPSGAHPPTGEATGAATARYSGCPLGPGRSWVCTSPPTACLQTATATTNTDSIRQQYTCFWPVPLRVKRQNEPECGQHKHLAERHKKLWLRHGHKCNHSMPAPTPEQDNMQAKLTWAVPHTPCCTIPAAEVNQDRSSASQLTAHVAASRPLQCCACCCSSSNPAGPCTRSTTTATMERH
jgi:hypothetical protein